MIENNANFYMLIKKSGATKSFTNLTPRDTALMLLNSEIWPLYKNTPCKKMVRQGEKVVIYLSGNQLDSKHTIASATIDLVEEWNERKHRKKYPIFIEQEPALVLKLKDIDIFSKPVDIKKNLASLSFYQNANPKKWGYAVMSGVRRITPNDFEILTSSDNV